MWVSIRSTLTFWTIIFFVAICALQVIPWTGIFLMVFGAPIWTGYILHLIAVALLVDIFYKRVPKLFLLIPLSIYGIYYLTFLSEFINIKSVESVLQQENPSEIISYNPVVHSLVADESLIKNYKIPVVYSLNHNFPEGFLSNRLATKELCNVAKNSRDSLYAFGVSWHKFGKSPYHKSFPNVCEFKMPDKPDKKILKVTRSEEKDKNDNLHKSTYSFYLDQEPLGKYISATYAKMPAFPIFFIGCGLNSRAPAWECFFQLRRERITMSAFPQGADQDDLAISPVARLLKIERYTEIELRSFVDYPETKEQLLRLAEGKDAVDEWGLRKDSLYRPKISIKNGFPSFEGIVHERNKGGYFYDFIKENEGKVVYLDIEARPNARNDSFMNYGVCKKGTAGCTSRTDTSYQFRNEDGKSHLFEQEGVFRGFFHVGAAIAFENKYNKGDNDTTTILTFIPEEKLNQ